MRGLIIALVAIAIAIDLAIVAVLVFDLQPPLRGGGVGLTPTVELTIYGGEITVDGLIRYAYGLSPDSLTAPGPTLNFTQGDVVGFTFVNVGEFPHTFSLVPKVDPSNPEIIDDYDTGQIEGGKQGRIIVQFNQAGNLNYQCVVPGHAGLGMWGNITVTA